MEYLLRRISILNTVGIFCIGKEEDAVQSFQEHSEYNPIAQSEALRQRLIGGAKRQKEPYICKDDFSVYFACI